MPRKNEAKWIESCERWQVNVQEDGERKTFVSSKPGVKGKIEAEKKADVWVEEKRGKDIRFEKLWADFLASLESQSKVGKKSENYIKHEQMGRLWILAHVKHKRLSAITRNDWQQCIDAAYAAGKSKRTCINIRASITAAHGFALSKRLRMEKPEKLKIQKDAPVGERNILQPNDLKKLFSIDYIQHYNKHEICHYIHAWRFLVLTGLRRGELCGLRKEHVRDGVLYIRQAYNRLDTKTSGKTDAAQRYIVLSAHMLKVLDDQQEALKKQRIISPWLFPDVDGQRTNSNVLYKRWLTYRDQHGIACNLHELRHTLVSIAQSDVPEALLKRLVGHTENMDTTGVYGHDFDGQMKRVADILDSIFDKLL